MITGDATPGTGPGGPVARWALLVHKPVVNGRSEPVPLELLGTFDGTYQDALQHLRGLVLEYRPRLPLRAQRVRRYRTSDGWLLVGEGSFGQSYPYRFVVHELEWDSGPL
ncbi:hypothetical protein ACIO3O_10865 [Streptomyces sp. NPDC087440]|uniref:hypothetical protein n=1 Tax=Streptomyces sp. NPDC087440 TaxID=3365790 RepID=UPI00381DBFAC